MLKTSDFAIMALVLLVVVLAAALIPALTGPEMTLGRAALAVETSPAVGQGAEWALSLGIKVLLGGAAVGLAAGIVAYLRERGRQGGGRPEGGKLGRMAAWRRKAGGKLPVSYRNFLRRDFLEMAVTGTGGCSRGRSGCGWRVAGGRGM